MNNSDLTMTIKQMITDVHISFQPVLLTKYTSNP